MSLYGKTTFGRACGAGSKSGFSDLLLNAQNEPNKLFYFQGSKNNPQAEYRQIRVSSVRLNANLPPPPPPPPPPQFLLKVLTHSAGYCLNLDSPASRILYSHIKGVERYE